MQGKSNVRVRAAIEHQALLHACAWCCCCSTARVLCVCCPLLSCVPCVLCSLSLSLCCCVCVCVCVCVCAAVCVSGLEKKLLSARALLSLIFLLRSAPFSAKGSSKIRTETQFYNPYAPPSAPMRLRCPPATNSHVPLSPPSPPSPPSILQLQLPIFLPSPSPRAAAVAKTAPAVTLSSAPCFIPPNPPAAAYF